MIPEREYSDKEISDESVNHSFVPRWFISDKFVTCEVWKNSTVVPWFPYTYEPRFIKAICIPRNGAKQHNVPPRWSEEFYDCSVGKHVTLFFYWEIDRCDADEAMELATEGRNPFKQVMVRRKKK